MPRRVPHRIRPLLWAATALLVLMLAAPQAWAWYHLREARAALANYHPEQARAALSACERVWGGRVSVRLLACRAAWQDGDPEAAFAELRAAQRLAGGATEETAFEWALLQASAGHFADVEEYLHRRAQQSPEVAPLIWEALSVGYLRVYRAFDAMPCLNLWLRHQPENLRALELRARAYVIGKSVSHGVQDYRKVLSMDPTRTPTRWRLIGCLLDLGSYDDAAAELELLARDSRDDPEIAGRLARCYIMSRRADDARVLLDTALANHPSHGLCLRIRGQLSLSQKQPAEAEAYLRRAVAVLAEDYQTQWLLFEAIRQQGKLEEARVQQHKAEEIKDRTERLGELQSRKLAEQPLDPALHYEMGVLLLRTGYPEVGEQWLHSALKLDFNHKPSHAALAEYYERLGNKTRAEEHRKKAGP